MNTFIFNDETETLKALIGNKIDQLIGLQGKLDKNGSEELNIEEKKDLRSVIADTWLPDMMLNLEQAIKIGSLGLINESTQQLIHIIKPLL